MSWTASQLAKVRQEACSTSPERGARVAEETREPQYSVCLEVRDRKGLTPLGLMANYAWHSDPKRLAFLFARYKFVARMLAGLPRVLEVGCADAFGTRVVRQSVPEVTAIDFDPVFVQDVQARMDPDWRFEVFAHDMLAGPLHGNFHGVYALDVIEHIPPAQEDLFVKNMVDSLVPHGVLIMGTPSLESQQYASTASRAGHVNCKSGDQWKAFFQRFFANVFVFSMNDEVIHTGFYPMAHYLFALCCTKLPSHEQRR
jgi:2-polyprenyl-3-methyl-5-hydroxy-6-metoxy-1,4-benzoquinol methylase